MERNEYMGEVHISASEYRLLVASEVAASMRCDAMREEIYEWERKHKELAAELSEANKELASLRKQLATPYVNLCHASTSTQSGHKLQATDISIYNLTIPGAQNQ